MHCAGIFFQKPRFEGSEMKQKCDWRHFLGVLRSKVSLKRDITTDMESSKRWGLRIREIKSRNFALKHKDAKFWKQPNGYMDLKGGV